MSGIVSLMAVPEAIKTFLVYQREGQNCLRCGNKILRKKQMGRSTFYCPNCQK